MAEEGEDWKAVAAAGASDTAPAPAAAADQGNLIREKDKLEI